MLPSRSTLRSWNPDSLTASAAAISSGVTSVADAVKGLDDRLHCLPETKAWSGRSQQAASAMFGRAERDASTFAAYGHALAEALQRGSGTIGPARAALLNKADQVDAGPLEVTDQWVVLIDPVRMSAEDMAELETLARSEQEVINGMLTAVGHADEATANAIVAAGKIHGFVEAGPPTNSGSVILPVAQRPGDQVPDPRNPIGVIAQEAIRAGDMSVTIRDVAGPVENKYGDEVTTVTMQDGSTQVLTTYDPFDCPSKGNFTSITQYDKDGNKVSQSSSWHNWDTDSDQTTITWPNGAIFTIFKDSTGVRTAGFTTADGRHSAVPVGLIDNISNGAGAAMSGFDKHLLHGGSFPMITAESLDDVRFGTRLTGPALTVATTVFDMAMAGSAHDRCVALMAGAGGFGGGWAAAEAGAAAGAAVGAVFPPAALVLVPVGAAGAGFIGGLWGADLGNFVGDVVCPY